MPRQKRKLEETEEKEPEENEEPPKKKTRRSKETSPNKKSDNKKGGKFNMECENLQGLIILKPEELNPTDKIAAFDLDWTIVKPKKTKFPKARNDWEWVFGCVPKKIKEIHSDGYRIVIFSNQNGIGTGKQRAIDVWGKIMDLSDNLDVPMTALLSTQKDLWRKPGTDMWDYFVENLNGGIKPDLKASYYVGDAAGRPKEWKNKKTPKDFSASDRKFAHNVGLPFYTPDAFFLKESECKTWTWMGVNPEQIAADVEKNNTQHFEGSMPIAKTELDMVIMVGPPGAGKSSFAKKFLGDKGYEYINRDTLKTQSKCQTTAENALKNNKNVVIDNTNPDNGSREPYIKLAKKYKANLRAFVLNVDRSLAEHLNLYRERITKGHSERIPAIAYAMYFKKFEEPTKNEGFNEICKINFVPSFDNDEHKKLFFQFY